MATISNERVEYYFILDDKQSLWLILQSYDEQGNKISTLSVDNAQHFIAFLNAKLADALNTIKDKDAHNT